MNFVIEDFSINGFALVKKIFSNDEIKELLTYTKDWISENIANSTNLNIRNELKDNFTLTNYKEFIDLHSIDHKKIAAAKYRYRIPSENIFKVIRGNKIMELVSKASKKSKFNIWQDPGFGWLGYRLIRPETNDGYPPSCKNWGAAAGVFSLWLPISGCNRNSSIRLLPGSHLREYEKYLPEHTKFTKGEFRLLEKVSDSSFVRLNCEIGDAIIYHPGTIHSEDSYEKKLTRINLEYRFMPKD